MAIALQTRIIRLLTSHSIPLAEITAQPDRIEVVAHFTQLVDDGSRINGSEIATITSVDECLDFLGY